MNTNTEHTLSWNSLEPDKLGKHRLDVLCAYIGWKGKEEGETTKVIEMGE